MRIQSKNKNFLIALLGAMVMCLTVTGCSEEKDQKADLQKSLVTKTEHNPFDHSHDVQVTDVEKHKFEHDFAQQCVQRELRNSTDKAADEARWQEPCMCIATYLMKGLTADEAGKFITEHKNTQSLVIKFENAAYHCLQAKAQPKGPKLFGRP
jgi:ribosomal protein L14